MMPDVCFLCFVMVFNILIHYICVFTVTLNLPVFSDVCVFTITIVLQTEVKILYPPRDVHRDT